MASQRFTKKDWALFREKLPEWQETYMDKINKEYIGILSGDGNPSDKFWQLDKRIKEDKRSPGVQLRVSRSDLIWDIIALINNDVIAFDDLGDFSNELQETIHTLSGNEYTL